MEQVNPVIAACFRGNACSAHDDLNILGELCAQFRDRSHRCWPASRSGQADPHERRVGFEDGLSDLGDRSAWSDPYGVELYRTRGQVQHLQPDRVLFVREGRENDAAARSLRGLHEELIQEAFDQVGHEVLVPNLDRTLSPFGPDGGE